MSTRKNRAWIDVNISNLMLKSRKISILKLLTLKHLNHACILFYISNLMVNDVKHSIYLAYTYFMAGVMKNYDPRRIMTWCHFST